MSERDLQGLEMARWGRVAATNGPPGWEVISPDGRRVEPIHEFLRELLARGAAPGTVRSYAFDLLRWWRFLAAVEVDWDKATSAEARDMVLWLQRTRKPIAGSRRDSAATAGTVNPVTRKPHQGDGYAARTVRHSNAVVRAFYDFWIDECGGGPLLNPMPREREWAGQRTESHRSPLEPFAPRPRLRYNPRLPRRRPRAIPDERWEALFAALRSDRDRAIAAMAISSGARAGELLGLTGADLNWGEQQIQVRRKGSGARQWLPVSNESLVWLRLYLAQIGSIGAPDPVWWTLRGRGPAVRGTSRAAATSPPPRGLVGRVATDTGPGGLDRRPLSYDALRAVFRRVNAGLGTNYSMHDLRHTCALRMVRDDRLSLRDVQHLLGHAHLSTTALYLHDDDAAVLGRVREHLAVLADRPVPTSPVLPAAPGYAAADLAVLLGTATVEGSQP